MASRRAHATMEAGSSDPGQIDDTPWQRTLGCGSTWEQALGLELADGSLRRAHRDVQTSSTVPPNQP
jgi:hypothetical protein